MPMPRSNRRVGTSNDLAFAKALKEEGATFLSYAFESHHLDPQSYWADLSALVSTGYKTEPLSRRRLGYNLVRELIPADAGVDRGARLPAADSGAQQRGARDWLRRYRRRPDGVLRPRSRWFVSGKRYCAAIPGTDRGLSEERAASIGGRRRRCAPGRAGRRRNSGGRTRADADRFPRAARHVSRLFDFRPHRPSRADRGARRQDRAGRADRACARRPQDHADRRRFSGRRDPRQRDR